MARSVLQRSSAQRCCQNWLPAQRLEVSWFVCSSGWSRWCQAGGACSCWWTADKIHPYLLCVAGLMLHLDNLKIYNPAALAKGAEYSGNVLVAPGATVGKGCLIGPDVSIGDGCVIGDGVRLSNCVVMRGVRIKDHSKVGAC